MRTEQPPQSGENHRRQWKSNLHFVESQLPLAARRNPVVTKYGEHASASGGVASDRGSDWNGRKGKRAKQRVELTPQRSHRGTIKVQQQGNVEAGRESPGGTRQKQRAGTFLRSRFDCLFQRDNEFRRERI